MRVTYLGTTTLLFDDGKDQILFDCHVTRPSIKTCLKGVLDSNTKIVDRVIQDFEIDRLRGIFVSHSHHDHVLDAPNFAVKCDCNVYGSPSTMNVALGNGVKPEHLFSFENAMEYQIGEFDITVIHSIHSEPHWYNDDIGMTIDEPFALPATKKAFKEGGSVDFLVHHQDKSYLIRPSYNFIEGQLDDIRADVLFLGIGGMSKDTKERHDKFFEETIGKVKPELVIPIHWDNFFTPLYGTVKGMPTKLENTGKAMQLVANYCMRKGAQCVVQLPLTGLNLGDRGSL